MTRPISATEPRRALLATLSGAESGSALVGFAFVLPVLLALTFGSIEFSLALLDYNRATEAGRRGAREAMILDPVADIQGLDLTVPVTCSIQGGVVACDGASVASAASFSGIVQAMQSVFPDLTAENVIVSYSSSRIGNVSLPSGVVPMITVSIVNLKHKFLLLPALPGMPSGFTFPNMEVTSIGNGAKPPGS